jgi:hypothetical protein
VAGVARDQHGCGAPRHPPPPPRSTAQSPSTYSSRSTLDQTDAYPALIHAPSALDRMLASLSGLCNEPSSLCGPPAMGRIERRLGMGCWRNSVATPVSRPACPSAHPPPSETLHARGVIWRGQLSMGRLGPIFGTARKHTIPAPQHVVCVFPTLALHSKCGCCSRIRSPSHLTRCVERVGCCFEG